MNAITFWHKYFVSFFGFVIKLIETGCIAKEKNLKLCKD